ncbi:MAG: Fic family protein [Clostridia bacterium]|nr:Fic family protein [Deltaproteobacteria bacterium]
MLKAQYPEALTSMREVAKIQSTESSNRIEGVVAPQQRVQALVFAGSAPVDRPEQQIAGYRDALALIHESAADMRPSANVIRQLHQILFRYTSSPGGAWKSAPNDITEERADGSTRIRFKPVPPFLVDSRMRELDDARERETGRYNELFVMAAYVFDFLCIHPFGDGNGRAARLLTLLFLYRAGYQVGAYISLERIIEESKESYYEALARSSAGWHEGNHDLTPWTEYLLGTITRGYHDFAQRASTLSRTYGGKTVRVRAAVAQLSTEFRREDIERLTPDISTQMIRVVLDQLKSEGAVEAVGRGRSAKWKKKL